MDNRLWHDLELLLEAFTSGQWKEVAMRSEGLSVRLAQGVSHHSPDMSLRAVSAGLAPEAPAAALPEAIAPDAAVDPAWHVVNAPNIGTFYRAPKPGSAPFVEIGQPVEEGAELCLIEVMKLFTSVRAPIAGTVRHIAAQDGALVEGGQPLMYIQPG